MMEIHELIIEARIGAPPASSAAVALPLSATLLDEDRIKREITQHVMVEIKEILMEERGNKT